MDEAIGTQQAHRLVSGRTPAWRSAGTFLMAVLIGAAIALAATAMLNARSAATPAAATSARSVDRAVVAHLASERAESAAVSALGNDRAVVAHLASERAESAGVAAGALDRSVIAHLRSEREESNPAGK